MQVCDICNNKSTHQKHVYYTQGCSRCFDLCPVCYKSLVQKEEHYLHKAYEDVVKERGVKSQQAGRSRFRQFITGVFFKGGDA